MTTLAAMSDRERRIAGSIYTILIGGFNHKLLAALLANLNLPVKAQKDLETLLECEDLDVSGFIPQIASDRHWALVHEPLSVAIANDCYDSRVRAACRVILDSPFTSVSWSQFVAEERKIARVPQFLDSLLDTYNCFLFVIVEFTIESNCQHRRQRDVEKLVDVVELLAQIGWRVRHRRCFSRYKLCCVTA
jgi:hypothetical protein